MERKKNMDMKVHALNRHHAGEKRRKKNTKTQLSGRPTIQQDFEEEEKKETNGE